MLFTLMVDGGSHTSLDLYITAVYYCWLQAVA